MSLVENNLAILTGVHDDGVNLRVTYYCTSRQKIAQTKFQNINHILFAVQNSYCTIKVIEIWLRQLSRHDKVNLILEVVIDLLLNFFNGQFRLQVSLSIELSGLDVATKLSILACGFQNNTIGWNLLLIPQHDNIPDLDILQLRLYYAIGSIFKSSNLINSCSVDFFI